MHFQCALMAPFRVKGAICNSLGWWTAGPVCGLLEEPVCGVEPIAQESAAAPDCPSGLASSFRRAPATVRMQTVLDRRRFNGRTTSL